MTAELQRRQLSGAGLDLSSLSEDKKKRSLELSAYFTMPTMEAGHMTIAWFAAMNLANKNKQYSTALNFANNLIEKGTNPKFKDAVSHTKAFVVLTTVS